jgi:hypothetical protein
MPSIVLRKFSEPQQLSNSSLLDTVKPLSYNEWLRNNIGIIPDQSQDQYNEYLTDWYKSSTDKNDLSIASNKIRDDYISLLKRLQIIFKDDETFARLTNINFDSPVEIKLAIPYFARKLKEIALYYVEQRENIKKSKLQYNLVGSNNALTKILYNKLLNSFTKKDQNISISVQEIYNTVPSLSSISEDFNIEIEELFDMTNYYDKAHLPNELGNYELVTNNPLLFILTDYIKNEFSALRMGEVPLSGFTNPLAPFVACENDLSLSIQTQALINQKYIGNDIYYLTGGYFNWDIRAVKLDMVPGNNFFYWFSGQQVRNIPEGSFLPVALSAWNYVNATGSDNIESSDIVFMSVGNIVTEGAWLKAANKITVEATMNATMLDNKLFRFPYPGKGTLLDDGSWTGKHVIDTIEEPRFFFPSETITDVDIAGEIEKLYWTVMPSISTAQSILLQDTTLYSSGAFAATKFNNADKIIVYPEKSNNPTSKILSDDLQIAWLYDFKQTNIAIKEGSNNLYYPLSSYENIDELFFRYESGNTVALADLDINGSFSGAIAGNKLDNSDVLLKLVSHCGPIVEVAWLSGYSLANCNPCIDTLCECDDTKENLYTKWLISDGVTQPGLAFKCDGGNYIRFMWSGARTKINDVRGFTGFKHDDNCPYKNINHSASILDINFLNRDNLDQYEKWRKCECKAVHHSPMGHNGSNLLDYGWATDFISKDTMFPSDFNTNLWSGADGKPYNTSEDVAWFKTASLIEKDVGWGEGLWQNNNGDEFYLEPGQTYIYYRSNLERCNFELPYFLINQCYQSCCSTGDCRPVWKKASIDSDGNYIETNLVSDMTLESGHFYTYIHRSSNSFSKTILNYDKMQVQSEEMVSFLKNDPLITYDTQTIEIPSINFALKIPLNGNDPYWGVASFKNDLDTNHKQRMRGAADFHIVYDYVQIAQPHPSQILLTNDATIEYQLSECNSCFIWEQPLQVDLDIPMRQWKKILFDDCVRSDILSYLHFRCSDECNVLTPTCYSECVEQKICGCDYTCFSTKIGVTATELPSDMLFNTELSGIPAYVNYFARNQTTISFNVTDVSNGYPPTGGIWVPPVSSLFVDASQPWENIINDFYSIVAAKPVTTSLSSNAQLGMFIPNRLSTGKYELHSADTSMVYDEKNPLRLFRTDNYTDDVYTIDSINSDWMKHRQGQNILGNIKIDKKQTFHPYSNDYQFTGINSYGLNNVLLETSPWKNNGEWADEENYPANITGLHPINCGSDAWFNTQYNLSGNIIEWQSDIYGNQYFLMNYTGTRLSPASSYNSFFIKDTNGKIFKGNELLLDIVNKYRNISL